MNSRWYYPAGNVGLYFGYFEPGVVARLMSWDEFEGRWPGPTSFAWVDHLSLCYFCVSSPVIVSDHGQQVLWYWSVCVTDTKRCVAGDWVPLPMGARWLRKVATFHVDCRLS